MDSRKTTRSSFSNGRSSSGEDSNGNCRPNGCSYISNVRPENRSTLCTIIAQLTEETQPSFETTLKSKAVSERCNVKFSCVVTGHPTPQVIWYKEDVQLDRYCGLPKYEIFHNGRNHSLHIYNCTLEDAAIYQASASNNKGIVSCSGVLEVGEMNEFKIHERYFAKLKQKADNRCREVEGKENLEPLRTISPDRTLRKRRSTMEAFLSTPSSMEDEGNEEGRQAVAAETEAGLQQGPSEKLEEKPTPITNGVVSAMINGEPISQNSSKSKANIYDPAQKIFTAHQPKAPFVKKKIKITRSAKVAKSDAKEEPTSEEQRAKEESPGWVTMTCTESPKPIGSFEEVMDVENSLSSSSGMDSRNVTEHQKSATEELLHPERTSQESNVHAEVTAPSQEEHRAASLPPSGLTGQTVSGTEGEETARKDAGEHPEMGKQSPHIRATQPQKSVAVLRPSKAKKMKDVTVVDTEEKSETPSGASSARRISVKAPRESRTALPPRRQAGAQLSEKETGPCQKKVSVTQPTRPSEVTQGHTKMTRNDAPVGPKVQLNHFSTEVQPPQKTELKSRTSRDEIKAPTFNCGPQAAIEKMAKDTWNHSRGSNESHMVPFTDIHKSPLQNPASSEESRECKVSPSNKHSQVAAPLKPAEETETQKKVKSKEVGKLIVQSDSKASNEKNEMETESVALGQTEKGNTKPVGDQDNGVVVVNAPDKQNEKSEVTLKRPEKSSSAVHTITMNVPDSDIGKPPETMNVSELQVKDIQETPIPKVISIAELLRSQIKALDSMLANSVANIPTRADDVVQGPTPTKKCKDLKNADGKRKPEVAKSERKTGIRFEETPLRNIKETLMEVYQQLQLDQELLQTEGPTLPPAEALEKPSLVPPADPRTTVGVATKDNNDICQETGLTLVSKPTGTVSQERETPSTVKTTEYSAQEANITILTHTKDEPVQDQDMEIIQKVPPEIKRKNETKRGTSEGLLDQHKMDDHNIQSSLFLNVQKRPVETALIADKDISMVEDFPKTDYIASTSPKASPRLKKRDFISSIPSATAQELASGARRKILKHKDTPEEAPEATSPVDGQTQNKDLSAEITKMSTSNVALSPSPSPSRRAPLLQPPAGELTPPSVSRSPVTSRKKIPPETPTQYQQASEEIQTIKSEEKPAKKEKYDPFKAPQVIRKIRAETFADASGHLKLWCQFFNVLSVSTIKWFKNEEEIAQIKRTAGDETQVNLAIVQASCRDSGVYRCAITNEYGAESTDCLLSAESLSGMSIREDLGVGEEIEMTSMVFSKGVADSGVWGNKFFGRVMMQESHIGDGCSHKVWRAKVIYGLEPVFESGNTCIIKSRNPITYGGKGEGCLIDRNLEIVTQECKIQNLAREYCKIFSAEARVIENFGPSLEVLPVYLVYRPANTVPYATVEIDLTGDYQRYAVLDHTGRLDMRSGSDVEQKCCALQHWIFQWTNGNMLLTRLEGVDTKITNVGISVRSTGHQGLSVEGNPKVFEHFVSEHRCNYFCGLLSLRSLKIMDSLLMTAKPKGSKSPLLQRKMAADSSPQMGRKASGSPRLPRKIEQEGRKNPDKQNPAADTPKVVKME